MRRPRSPSAAAPASTRLAATYQQRFAKTIALTAEIKDAISDLQFTDAYRVPFQYSRLVRERLRAGPFSQSSRGVTLTDVDGNQFYDLDRLLRRQPVRLRLLQGLHRAGRRPRRRLGPVLGACIRWSPTTSSGLTQISGLDEVSFHMSGTEAVMQAVRLARYHTGRTHLVRFCGAYHGWWGDVQPGVGNPVPAGETYTLADMSERDAARARDPPRHRLRAGQSAAGPASRTRRRPAIPRWSTARAAPRFDRAGLHGVAAGACATVCTRRGIVLIFDEVFVGFRLAPGGAQEYFGVRADLVTYGKTLGGGFPVGVVCGRATLHEALPRRPSGRHLLRARHLQRPPLRDGRDARVPAAAGDAEDPALYDGLDERWNGARRGSTAASRRRACRCASPTCRRIWTVSTPARRATTGCSSTTCAPKAWR